MTGPAVWTDKRQAVLAWLRHRALSLGQLYEACVTILYVHNPAMPGWSRLVGHAVREIRNRLPDEVAGKRETTHVQYVQILDKIAEKWRRSGLSITRDTALAGEEEAGASVDEFLTVPRPLYEQIRRLVQEHLEGRERHVDRAYRLFEALMPETKGNRENLEPTVNRWLDITEWFMKKTHDSSAGDGQFDIAEFRAQFEIVEDALAGLIQDFFKTTDELDKILEEANS